MNILSVTGKKALERTGFLAEIMMHLYEIAVKMFASILKR